MRTELSSVAELPEMHLMGHTCTNLNGDLMFVWGGTGDNVASFRAPNTDLWIYETLTGYWRHRKCSGECPPYLSSCSSALIGQKIFVFGGHSPAQDNWLNCLYCLDLDTFVWSDLGAQARAEPTKPVRSDKNVAWAYANRMYVFGGYGWSQVEHYLELTDCQADLQLVPDFRWPKFGWNNQLVEYNPADRTWRWPSYKGKCPSARAAHSGALMGDKYFVFGGRDSHERLNDLYTFDMRTFEWQQIAVVRSTAFTFDRQLTGQQPIGHLLDDLRRSSDSARMVSNGDASDDTDSEHIDPAADENHRQLVEEMHDVEVEEDDCWNPHPSSSTNTESQSQDAATTSLRGGGGRQAEDDDDESEHPHPSQLMERWSLSLRNPSVDDGTSHLDNPMDVDGSSGNDVDDADCLHRAQQQQDQEQNFMSVTDRSQETLSPPVVQSSQQVGEQSQAQGADPSQPELAQNNHDQQNDQEDPTAPPSPQPSGRDDGSTTLPTGRSFCSLTPISNESMLLFGGVDSQDKNLDDCWLFNIGTNQWTQIADYKYKRSRLWHTGAKTKQNEVVIIGGSSSEKINEYCTDVLVMSFEPKSLKRSALDAVSRSVRIKTIQRTKGLPSTLVKLIKLRKQAMALTMRRSTSQRLLTVNNNNS